MDMWAFAASALIFSRSADAMRVLNLISFFMFFSNRSFKWVRASARNLGAGPCPAQCIWQGSGFAADQTNAMLAVGGTSCISLVSVAAADENSLTPLHRLLPTETASLGFGGSPVGGGDKNSRVIFFTFLCGGGITTLRLLWLCRNNPARGLFRQKKRLSQSGCSAPTDTLFPPAHSAFSALLCEVVSLPSACASCR